MHQRAIVKNVLPFGIWGVIALCLNFIIIGIFALPNANPLLADVSTLIKLILWYAFISSILIVPAYMFLYRSVDGNRFTITALILSIAYILLYVAIPGTYYYYFPLIALFLLTIYLGYRRMKIQEFADGSVIATILGGISLSIIIILLGVDLFVPSGQTNIYDPPEFDWGVFAVNVIIPLTAFAAISLLIEFLYRHYSNKSIFIPMVEVIKNAFRRDKKKIDWDKPANPNKTGLKRRKR